MKVELEEAMRDALTEVLETVFFTEPILLDAESTSHQDDLRCNVICSGAKEGIFTLTVDRAALQRLCEIFYADEPQPSEAQQREVLCELTNMIAGATLSKYAPEHACRLSPPSLCNPGLEKTWQAGGATESAALGMLLEGGMLSLYCTLRSAP